MEHFQHIDIMEPGAVVRLVFAACAWVLDRDAWGWVCGAIAILNLLPLADPRRTRIETRRAFVEFGGWSAIALLFAYYRAPAIRWLDQPTFEAVPWPVVLALGVGGWLFGAAIFVGSLASLFGCRAQTRVISEGHRRTGLLLLAGGIVGVLTIDRPDLTFAGGSIIANVEWLYSLAAYYGSYFVLPLGAIYVLVGVSKARRESLAV